MYTLNCKVIEEKRVQYIFDVLNLGLSLLQGDKPVKFSCV